MNPEYSQNQDQEEIQTPAQGNTAISPTQSTSTPETPQSFSLNSTLTELKEDKNVLVRGTAPLNVRPSHQSFITNQITIQPSGSLQSPMSFIMPSLPPSLFLQALNKLSENPINAAKLNSLKMSMGQNKMDTAFQEGELTPPDSLTSAPPSYSFVLRQMAARHRPRLMGTFIPSPSFVQHTPPPNYATAFDIYVDSRLPQTTPRICNFGFTSMAAVCPECGYTGMTLVISKITLCTHMSAFILCVFCCWICAPLPYILRSCKDVYHYCRNCRTFLGLYCPTNPENNYN